MTAYQIFTSDNISDTYIKDILHLWNIAEWKDLSPTVFREQFVLSEFHILKNEEGNILSLARIHTEFKIRISQNIYIFHELVGLVSKEEQKGFGKILLQYIINNLQNRGIETIGFCEKSLRPFYQKVGIDILPDQANYLQEFEKGLWVPSSDDDILCIHLSPQNKGLLLSLSQTNSGYLV